MTDDGGIISSWTTEQWKKMGMFQQRCASLAAYFSLHLVHMLVLLGVLLIGSALLHLSIVRLLLSKVLIGKKRELCDARDRPEVRP
jgi:hypothetical protein